MINGLSGFRNTLMILAVLAVAGPVPVFGEQAESQKTTGIESLKESAPPEEDEQKPKRPRKIKKVKDPNRGRILPVPIFITEPAIGDGLGLALTFFHSKKEVSKEAPLGTLESISSESKEQEPPPTVTGVFGAYTSNKTAAAGAGHMNSFKNDHIRFTGMAAWADVNSTFYLLDRPIKFNLKGVLAFQETRFRFADSRWFWGIGLSYLDASTALRLDLPDGTPFELFPNDLKNVGLSGKLAWDSRDNTSMPNKGQLADLAIWRYDEAIGGDFDYWNTRLKLISFHQLRANFVLGLRLEYSAISGAAPFYAVPFVSLRGIPALRYQGERVAVAEIEGRYNFSSQWAMVVFAGSGKVNSDIPNFNTEQNIYSYGLGARYRIFEVQNVWLGLDIARGPEETNWYIQIGQAW